MDAIAVEAEINRLSSEASQLRDERFALERQIGEARSELVEVQAQAELQDVVIGAS